MPQEKTISPDLGATIICMSSNFCVEEISVWTGVSTHSIERILSLFKLTGMIQKPKSTIQYANRQHMTEEDVNYILGSVKLTPDLYLDELQDMLKESCG
ncbi:hypothetical protein FRC02_012071 [Tulasnella sp. 418]|nr:hypothetical protein FRC02_012071 [Tulasnella sp. 418]